MRMSTLLNEVRNFELDEGFSPKEIKMAIGIASDPRYAKGNMTGAVNAIEKMKKGLSKHPQVAAVLKRQNENLDEMVMKYVLINMQGKVQGYASDKKDALDIAKRTKSTMHPIKKKITDKTLEKMNALAKTPKELADLGIIDEAVSPAQQAAIAISKKERGEKPKKEGNAFGMALKAARDKGDKTFMVSGKKYNVEDYDIKEDGHTDVASAVRQCKTIVEDATQIMSKLQGMSPEESLPSWWTNKLAVSSNSMNKLRDYFLVPTTEEVELDEKAGDIPDLKKLVGELQNASKMHLAQSKRVQAHVDMMDKANAKGPEGAGGLADLKKIVGELEKASEAHKRQSKSIEAHVKFMGEETLDEKLNPNLLKRMDDDNLKSYYLAFARDPIRMAPQDREIFKALAPEIKKRKIQFSKPEQDLIKKAMKSAKNPNMYEETQLDELKMNDPKLVKIFDKIKPRDTIQLKVSSGLSKGKGLQPYTVRSKNTLRNGVEKITMILQGNPTGVKRFLYKKDGKVTFAIGDMAASIDDIKEEMIEDIITEGNLNKKQMFDAVKKDVKSGLGKIAHRVVDTGSRFEVYVDSNDEKDAQRAMKDYILYAAGKLRVIPESAIIEQVTNIRVGYQTLTEKVDPADIDDTATDKDIENAGKNIIMQLRKSVSMRGNKDVEFADGKKKVDMRIAQKAIDMHMKMRTSSDKLKFQNSIAKSYKDLLNTVKGR